MIADQELQFSVPYIFQWHDTPHAIILFQRCNVTGCAVVQLKSPLPLLFTNTISCEIFFIQLSLTQNVHASKYCCVYQFIFHYHGSQRSDGVGLEISNLPLLRSISIDWDFSCKKTWSAFINQLTFSVNRLDWFWGKPRRKEWMDFWKCSK